ncbi:MAG: Uncharacterised protein [Alphaproteobacteria bacterium UBA4588]|jgi:hypothetical protein|nr:hypothetical protein [Alphaproteobacteria bacterium]CAI8333459.1 MAG: Uncharacterised protein [Alphaproteobacteria bacterium UBA4588]
MVDKKPPQIQIKRKRRQRSLGEMISTVCFFVLGAVLSLQAADFLDAGYQLRGYILAVCAFSSVCGGLRFIIADVVNWFRSSS